MQFQKLPWKRLLISAGLIVLLLVFLGAGFIWYLIVSAPDIEEITVSPTESATYICDEDGSYLRKLTFAAANRDIVDIEEIPELLCQAFVAIEDERFYEHGGIDLRGIVRAFVKGLTSGTFSEGASTITQQLIKNSVFTTWTQETSFLDRFRRKVQEQYLALQLEERMEKEEILQHYLNTINMGAGCYGVQAASRRYFGKDVSELTLSECAVLAAIPQNPSGYNPIPFSEANKKRAKTVLERMEEQKYITEGQNREAQADSVYERILAYDESYEEASVYTYYEDALIEQVTETLTEELGWTQEQAGRAIYSGGLRIYTAQDRNLQQICEEEFQNSANFPADTQLGIDYAVSIADEYGLVTHYGSDALRAFIRRTKDSEFNLLCSSEEEAQEYADYFREYLLEKYRSEADQTERQNEAEISVIGERLSLSPQPQASLVLLEQSTGLVKAVVGGRGDKNASLTLNRAVNTTRQPGSTFKILTAYAPALDRFGQTLVTEYENKPYKYADGTPVSNWDINDYSGSVTIREAIARSVNVAAVRCITEITPQVGFEYAEKFGITTLHKSLGTSGGTASDMIQPLALGGITQGVTALELCSAYGTIGNQGVYCEPKFFTKILDRNGKVILDYTESGNEKLSENPVIKESTAYLLTSAMQDVVSDPSGTAYGSISAAGHPVAGKTGTTSDYKDIWFAGYTPYYTCCVWGGYDNNQNLADDPVSHSYSKILWSAVMNRIHSELPVRQFEQPDTVTAVNICSDSHRDVRERACPNSYIEYFEKGTEPTGICEMHEVIPETENITIYPDILDELLTETESFSEMITELITEQESEELPEHPSEGNTETLPDQPLEESSEKISEEGSEDVSELDSELDSEQSTNSFDDFMNRLLHAQRLKNKGGYGIVVAEGV